MRPPAPIGAELREIVDRALREDVRSGDVTTEAVVPPEMEGRAEIVARESLVPCALDVAAACFLRLDEDLCVGLVAEEGVPVDAGKTLVTLEGRLSPILTGERVALNLLQRACGIATATRELVDLLSGTGVDLLDTRKTAPGLRALDRLGVRTGGGRNHRLALDDMILVKDNHVRAAGSVVEATRRALAAAGHALKVEVEVDDLDQLEALLREPRLPDAVLLDNFTPEDVREAVALVGGRARVEVSGGITRATIRSFAEAGPDAVSLGALTHRVRAADLALDVVSP